MMGRAGHGSPGGCEVAVDERERRAQAEARDGAAHREEARLQDVHRLDLRDAGDADPDHRAAAQRGGELVAALRRQPLAVVDAVGDGCGVEDHRRGDDRAGPGTAADLVDAADRPGACDLVGEVRCSAHVVWHRPHVQGDSWVDYQRAGEGCPRGTVDKSGVPCTCG